MPSTTGFEFGEVVLIPFPFTDQSAAKRRPAVVVSSRRYNSARRDVIVIAVTSQARTAGDSFDVVLSAWRGAGLLKPSVLKPLPATIEAELVTRRLGWLGSEDLESLNQLLAEIIGE